MLEAEAESHGWIDIVAIEVAVPQSAVDLGVHEPSVSIKLRRRLYTFFVVARSVASPIVLQCHRDEEVGEPGFPRAGSVVWSGSENGKGTFARLHTDSIKSRTTLACQSISVIGGAQY